MITSNTMIGVIQFSIGMIGMIGMIAMIAMIGMIAMITMIGIIAMIGMIGLIGMIAIVRQTLTKMLLIISQLANMLLIKISKTNDFKN